LFAPQAYAAAEPRTIIRDHPFALLVTTDANGLHATPTPLYFETDDPEENRLIGHLARRNPQAQGLQQDQDCIAFFSGPHSYISGAWYRQKREVPTWNYIAAEVRGTLDPLDGSSENLAVLERISEALNKTYPSSWRLEDAPQGRIGTLLPHIRSFRITIREICGVTKLSQTHPPRDRAKVIQHLLERGDGWDIAVATLMQANETASEP
jgi:transcriptional regulator